MSLFLIRHGETALNAARVMQPADTPLSALGLRQAEALAQRLGGAGLAAIVSSDLPRAWRTAEALAATTALPITPSALLHERNFGDLRGRPHDALGFDPLTMVEAPAGGESAAAFAERVAQAFAFIVALRATLPGPLAVVTHGLLIRTLLEAHAQVPASRQPLPRIGNTALTIVAAQAPHAVLLLDSTSHLDAALRDGGHSLSGG